MKKSTQTLCVVLIAGILTAVSIGALIAILASDEPTIKDQISQAEQEKLDRQEQYKDLLEIVPERDTIPSRPTLPEPPDITLPGSDNYNSVDTAYEVIISTLKDRAESCELRVGNSIRPKSAESLSGDQPCVYSSDEAVVTVSEDYTITAMTPGTTYVLFHDGETFLVYACVVTE